MKSQLESKRLLPSQMMTDLDDFMADIDNLSQLIGLDCKSLQADHVALRINDCNIAEAAHQAWLEHGTVISEATVNGRPIVVLEFHKPLKSRGWGIQCLELPYPAEGKRYPKESWEHVEFVVPSSKPVTANAEQYLLDLRQQYPDFDNRFEQLGDAGVTVKVSSPSADNEQLPNPTVAFKKAGISIKIHPYSLKQVVLSEQK